MQASEKRPMTKDPSNWGIPGAVPALVQGLLPARGWIADEQVVNAVQNGE